MVVYESVVIKMMVWGGDRVMMVIGVNARKRVLEVAIDFNVECHGLMGGGGRRFVELASAVGKAYPDRNKHKYH